MKIVCVLWCFYVKFNGFVVHDSAFYRREANGGTNFIRVCLCVCLFVCLLVL